MDFILENWFVIVAMVALVTVAGYVAVKFFKMPSDAQLKKVREWLLYAVTEAEKQLGSGTGKLKLRYVYDMFIGKFPAIAKVITFEQFSLLVDDALVEMREMLSNNKNVAAIVAGEPLSVSVDLNKEKVYKAIVEQEDANNERKGFCEAVQGTGCPVRQ